MDPVRIEEFGTLDVLDYLLGSSFIVASFVVAFPSGFPSFTRRGPIISADLDLEAV
jgi:hypothetical protein